MRSLIISSTAALIMVVTVSCTKESEQVKPIEPMELLGLTENQIVSRFGEPNIRGEAREGLQEFMYQDIRFDVLLENNVVTACTIGDGSSVSLNDQIRCGVPIERVTEIYGKYESEQTAEKGTSAEDFVQGVLYYERLSGDTERYSLRYPDEQLLFTFYPDKTLHSVWIGKLY